MHCMYIVLLLAIGNCEPIKEHRSKHRDENTTLLKDQNVLKSYRNEEALRYIKDLPKISHGVPVMEIEEYPFMALLVRTHSYKIGDYLMKRTHYYCGATILNTKYLLTAAHCLKKCGPNSKMQPAEEYTVHAGGLSIDQALVKTNVTRYFIHEGYSCYKDDTGRSLIKMTDDIAVVELEDELQFTEKISQVKLPSRLEPTRLENCLILGFGNTSVHSISERQKTLLQEGKVKIVENTHRFADNFVCSDPTKICNADDKRGSCSGDSGGPLLCNGEQVGIVSYGDKYCMPGRRNVNTRVEYYLDWIKATINGNTK